MIQQFSLLSPSSDKENQSEDEGTEEGADIEQRLEEEDEEEEEESPAEEVMPKYINIAKTKKIFVIECSGSIVTIFLSQDSRIKQDLILLVPMIWAIH